MEVNGEDGRLIAGRYRIGARLGRGGMGTVRRAEDRLLGRQVAVKELHPDEGLTGERARRLSDNAVREARALAQVAHPGVVVVHDVVEEHGRPWIVMELIDGPSLADVLEQQGTVAPREAARIGLALLGALNAAHQRGVLHRDLKPANVLLESGTGRVVLTDFGIAQVPGATTVSRTGAFVGSPEYTAPERMEGRPCGGAADLWSLGALLCKVVAGRTPFERDTLTGVLHAVALAPITVPGEAEPLGPVVHGLLERDPDARITAGEAERLLQALLDTGRMPTGEPEPLTGSFAHPPAPDTRAWPEPADEGTRERPVGAPARRRFPVRTVAAVAAAVVLAGGGAAAVLLGSDGDDAARGPGAPGASRPADGKPEDGAVPEGYREVADPAGFRVAVPKGYVRSWEPPRVFYHSPGKKFRIGFHIQRRQSGGAEAEMRRAHREGPERYRGYRDGSVRSVHRSGHPGAVWEFTWDGAGADSGPRHTLDLSWDQEGKMYDVWISGPTQQQARTDRHFDVLRRTFRPVRAG